MISKLLTRNNHVDARGTLFYNNDFDSTPIKRIYVIENQTTNFARVWRGHKIEQRWFSAVKGSFKIELIAIHNWEHPSGELKRYSFVIYSETMDVLHFAAGFVSSIQSLVKGSRLLVMSDYSFGLLMMNIILKLIILIKKLVIVFLLCLSERIMKLGKSFALITILAS